MRSRGSSSRSRPERREKPAARSLVSSRGRGRKHSHLPSASLGLNMSLSEPMARVVLG